MNKIAKTARTLIVRRRRGAVVAMQCRHYGSQSSLTAEHRTTIPTPKLAFHLYCISRSIHATLDIGTPEKKKSEKYQKQLRKSSVFDGVAVKQTRSVRTKRERLKNIINH